MKQYSESALVIAAWKDIRGKQINSEIQAVWTIVPGVDDG
jgi:hypothetical protein